jgi:hypothetical protein
MHATIRSRLESRPVASFRADILFPEVDAIDASLAVASQDGPPMSQPLSPSLPRVESVVMGSAHPEFRHPEASPASRDAMCA